MGSPVGQVVGALFAAFPMERFGRKRTFAACVVVTAGIVFIQFFARDSGVLALGELIAGLVLGVFVVIAPTYSSEVCPTAVRGHLTSCINLCFVLGQLAANGVVAGTQHLRSHWAYSLPFALQWLWVAIIIPGLFFAPESPWWLVRRGLLDDARDSLRRLSSSNVDVAETLAFIVETNRLEVELEAGSTYRDCFRRVNLRRTEISSGVYCAQVLSGIYLINYGTYFFQQAGLPTDHAFDMSVGFLGEFDGCFFTHAHLSVIHVLTVRCRCRRWPGRCPRVFVPPRPRGAPRPLRWWPGHSLRSAATHRHPRLYPRAPRRGYMGRIDPNACMEPFIQHDDWPCLLCSAI